ncbi:MAG: hypothetical protein LBK73_08825 [Treponema sp.]|jgi:hypothetical protein|nr:hypothetical protein [Treponema sp.]
MDLDGGIMRTQDRKADWQYDKEENKILLEILYAVNDITGVESECIELIKGRESNLDRWQYAKERNLLLGKLKTAIDEYKNTLPARPTEEGEYTLKASVNAGGGIVYSWVADE